MDDHVGERADTYLDVPLVQRRELLRTRRVEYFHLKVRVNWRHVLRTRQTQSTHRVTLSIKEDVAAIGLWRN